MKRIDERGVELSGANAAAADLYERALMAACSWRSGAGTLAIAAQQEAPAFVMAHVLQAHLLACSRDPSRVRAAHAVVERAKRLRSNADERMHIAAISAVLADHYERAKALLGQQLMRQPRDLLALNVVHALDYVTGDIAHMLSRVECTLPAWNGALPGRHAVLAMHAFSLEESNELELAETRAHDALALNPHDARAHHVMAHVFEAGDRDDEGIAWMKTHASAWQPGTTVTTHGWWHVALFHLARAEIGHALALYDTQVRSERSADMADLLDATSLLWRIQLAGGDAGQRWSELAHAWDAHIDNAFCSFTDLHAMLAFVGARDGERARRLELVLARAQTQATRHGETTRRLGLPACRALIAYGRGDLALAVTLLASLPTLAHRLGGSHAQRDVLHLTLLHAMDRLRRPGRGSLAATARTTEVAS